MRAIFLKIDCPAITGGAVFKSYPGLQIIKSIRLLSAGQQVYEADCERFLVDYCESLTEEQLKNFATQYLGHQSTPDATARTFMIPLLLPNSQYMARNGHDTRGFGVWPAFLGQNRLEIQLTLNTSNYTSASNSDAPATIAGKCSLLYHQVEMTAENLQKYSETILSSTAGLPSSLTTGSTILPLRRVPPKWYGGQLPNHRAFAQRSWSSQLPLGQPRTVTRLTRLLSQILSGLLRIPSRKRSWTARTRLTANFGPADSALQQISRPREGCALGAIAER